MKYTNKITMTLVGLAAPILFLGCAGNAPAPAASDVPASVLKLNVANVCNPKKQSLESIIALAEKYNPTAVKLGVEFKRLGIANSVYIKDTKKAIAAGDKITVLHYKKKGKAKTKKMPTTKAAWRACTFAIRALQERDEAAKTYRLAIPGDGFKY